MGSGKYRRLVEGEMMEMGEKGLMKEMREEEVDEELDGLGAYDLRVETDGLKKRGVLLWDGEKDGVVG